MPHADFDNLSVTKPWLMLGDCLERMKEIQGGSVDLTVTSPPYDGVRSYNGYSFDFDAIAADLFRVTKPGGVVVWIVADQTVKGSETGTSFRQALHFKRLGLNLHDTMIYQKASQPRESARYEQHFEYMFVFSKGRMNTFNPLKVPTKNAGRVVNRTCRDNHLNDLSRSSNVVAIETKRGNVWFYGSKQNGTGHPAVFPEALAADHIASWSNPGDVVFDPFTGSGTTGKMAVLAGRRFIGIEISDQYLDIARRRIDAAIAATQPAPQGGLFADQHSADSAESPAPCR